MIPLLVLAAAAALPLTADEQADLRCIGVVATAGGLPAKATAEGREFAVIVGGDLMDRTGRTREQVADLMLAEGKAATARRPFASELADCALRIDARLQGEAASAPLPKPAG